MNSTTSLTTHPFETQEISLRLEHYDDIFSDFDMRPYEKRAISVDFLDEIKRATRDKEIEDIELILNVPAAEKSEVHEATIKERLAAHFERHYHVMLKEKHKVMSLGISMVIFGIACMVAATYIIFEDPAENLLLSFLVVFLEPAAWFLLWEGMDQIIFNSKNIQPELDFYRKMSAAHERVYFTSY